MSVLAVIYYQIHFGSSVI